MPTCLTIDANNIPIISTVTNIQDCGAILMSGVEYNQLLQDTAIANLNTTINALFEIPASTMLAQAWSVGFVLPMTIGLVSFVVAKMVNFWD